MLIMWSVLVQDHKQQRKREKSFEACDGDFDPSSCQGTTLPAILGSQEISFGNFVKWWCSGFCNSTNASNKIADSGNNIKHNYANIMVSWCSGSFRLLWFQVRALPVSSGHLYGIQNSKGSIAHNLLQFFNCYVGISAKRYFHPSGLS